ncbi:hypothetical protein WMY93_034126, partial [Mugilogobius chulae]
VRCEELTALKPEVCAEQGKQVSLEYYYEKGATAGDQFYWYRQYSGKPPEFIYSHLGSGMEMKKQIQGVSVQKSKDQKRLLLSLSSAAVGDSAVYYCAVRPTVTANPQSLNKKLINISLSLWVEFACSLRVTVVLFGYSSFCLQLSLYDSECKGEDTVSQPAGDVLLTQGDTGKIECNYKTSDSYPYLFWYKQDGRGALEYLLRIVNTGTIDRSSKFNKAKFDAKLNKTSLSLIIQDVDVTDSAVYYCALQPTVTGNTKTLNKNLWSKDNTILQ